MTGYDFYHGLMQWTSRIVRVIVIGIVALFILELSPLSRDDTDPTQGWGARSGVRLITDHGTGCQYLATRGAIIPRVDATGRHMCNL